MKPRVKKTFFRTAFARPFILLLLALLVASWQFSASATPTKSGDHANAFGIDCITPEDQEKQPAPDGGDSPNLPDSPSDIDDSDGELDDLSADNPMRTDQDTPLFSVTDRDAVALRTPRMVPILLLPVHCFYCLHEHIRERAPPCLELNI